MNPSEKDCATAGDIARRYCIPIEDAMRILERMRVTQTRETASRHAMAATPNDYRSASA